MCIRRRWIWSLFLLYVDLILIVIYKLINNNALISVHISAPNCRFFSVDKTPQFLYLRLSMSRFAWRLNDLYIVIWPRIEVYTMMSSCLRHNAKVRKREGEGAKERRSEGAKTRRRRSENAKERKREGAKTRRSENAKERKREGEEGEGAKTRRSEGAKTSSLLRFRSVSSFVHSLSVCACAFPL